jgi:hypothetical protein
MTGEPFYFVSPSLGTLDLSNLGNLGNTFYRLNYMHFKHAETCYRHPKGGALVDQETLIYPRVHCSNEVVVIE